MPSKIYFWWLIAHDHDRETLMTQLQLRSLWHEGWQLFQQYPAELLGFSAVSLLIQSGLQGLPILGWLALPFFVGPLILGLNWGIWQRLRDRDRPFSDFWIGFQHPFLFWQSFWAVTWISTIALICWSPWLIGAVGLWSWWEVNRNIAIAIGSISSALGLIGFVSFCYLMIGYQFTFLLIADCRLRAWPAMQRSLSMIRSQWLPAVIGMILWTGVSSAVAIVTCCLGLVVILPLFYCCLAVAYQRLQTLEQPLDQHA
ncbi:hypothetical protein VZH09_11840 [Synechococcus elongatus IITB7]|uniref:hypothetical protein n=1 Tax=Synechococcus elongatus TaxID=32046 RepID=UPI0030CF8DE1